MVTMVNISAKYPYINIVIVVTEPLAWLETLTLVYLWSVHLCVKVSKITRPAGFISLNLFHSCFCQMDSYAPVLVSGITVGL